MSTPRAPARPDKRPAPEGGAELRNYRLIERLAQEELATVYRASHLTLDRPVQVHILRRHDWVSASRFQLAARLAARLSHPNLVPVIDAGHDDKYRDYLVTPQLDARPLSALLADGPAPAMLAVRVVAQVAAALDYLHAQQVFHRDVQPANILVTQEGVAYLTNLSLAASPDTPDLSSIDEADYLTPYSAPEQRLAAGEAGAALDVYSLGAVAYHMLSGEIPPGGELPSLAAHDAALVPADKVLARMLAARPEARFPSAAAAAAALRQALRSSLDQATADMEESRWEASAEWLENPVETALGPTLDEQFSDFVARARKRADELHRRDVIRRLLNRWSRDGFFRRRPLGQLVQPEQIVSYNVYFYELRALYETRSAPQPRTRPQQPEDRSSYEHQPDIWAVPVPIPDGDTFATFPAQEIAVPNSARILTCPECSGAAVVLCSVCKGKGTVEKVSKVSNPDNKTTAETLTAPCQACRGYGKQQCPKCKGSGNLVEELAFSWSRRAKLFENTDDIEDLPRLAIQKRLEPVFSGPINPYEGRWHSVAPLAELLRTAIEEAGEGTRMLTSELKIQGATITEMDYVLDEKPQRLYLVGFDSELIGDWALLNSERLILAAAVAVLALIAVAAVAFAIAG
jgi:serine/threonine protein kinase